MKMVLKQWLTQMGSSAQLLSSYHNLFSTHFILHVASQNQPSLSTSIVLEHNGISSKLDPSFYLRLFPNFTSFSWGLSSNLPFCINMNFSNVLKQWKTSQPHVSCEGQKLSSTDEPTKYSSIQIVQRNYYFWNLMTHCMRKVKSTWKHFQMLRSIITTQRK